MSSLKFDDVDTTNTRGTYANPSDTIAQRDTPTNIKMIMRLTRFYYNRDGLIKTIIDKMAEYPITDIIVSEKEGTELSSYARREWDKILDIDLNLRKVMVEMNIDKKIYGQSFWYLYLPFVRYCVCPTCSTRTPISSLPIIKSVNVSRDTSSEQFVMNVNARCKTCKVEVKFSIEDKRATVRDRLRLIRLDPLRMKLESNPVTGEKRWYYEPSRRLSDGLTNGDRTIIDTTEMGFLEAAVGGKHLLLNSKRMFIAQATTQPGIWDGWACPPLFPVLEDIYYYKILRRANEALASEHVTPIRVITPSGTGDVSPQRTVGLSEWSRTIRGELQKFKRDPNYMMVSPIPLNIEQIGGQGRVMMVATEIEAAARVVATGLGCPIELVWGGLNYTGASVALRVLENHFMNERRDSERMLRFIVGRVAQYFKLPDIDAHLSNFHMADDPGKQANMMNLMTQGFVSREGTLPEFGIDPKTEWSRMKDEHAELNKITMQDNVSAAHMNVVIKTLESKAEVLMQYELQAIQKDLAAQDARVQKEEINAYVQQLKGQGYTTSIEFQQAASLLGRLQPEMQGMILENWQQTMPHITELLMEMIGFTGGKPKKEKKSKEVETESTGAQDPGAAGGPGMAQGASGPYGNGQGDGGGAGAVESGSSAVQGTPGDGHGL